MFLCISCAIMSLFPGIFLFTVTLPCGDDNDQMALPVGLKRIRLRCVLAQLYSIERYDESVSRTFFLSSRHSSAFMFRLHAVFSALFPRAVSWCYCTECASSTLCLLLYACATLRNTAAVAHKVYWSHSLETKTKRRGKRHKVDKVVQHFFLFS